MFCVPGWTVPETVAVWPLKPSASVTTKLNEKEPTAVMTPVTSVSPLLSEVPGGSVDPVDSEALYG
jgi:hypothetical protein